MDDVHSSAVAEAVPDSVTPQTQIVRRTPKALSQRDPVRIAQAFFKSGYFKDVKSMEQAVVKIVAGEEIGLGPMAAIKGITMIEGQLGYTANLVATLVKQHPTYEYRVVETTDERCEIDFYDDGDKVGTSVFTVEDAERAGLVKPKSNWEKYPRAMCFNRALTQGVRAYVPDVTAGTPAYSDDEIEEVITTAPVAEDDAADAAVVIDEDRAQRILAGVNALGLAHPAIDLILGSCGIDALASHDNEAVVARIKGLSEDQADAVEAELDRMAETGEGDTDA